MVEILIIEFFLNLLMKILNLKNHSDETISSAISNALQEAKRAGIEGKDTTPFLLNAVGKITQGKSLETSN